MTDKLTEALRKQFVTSSETVYLLENYARPVEDNTGALWIDPLDKRIRDVLLLPRPIELEYSSARTLGGHSFVVYGTITLGWLLLLCSGYKYANEIPNKTVIRLPAKTSLIGYASQETPTTQVGQTVVF